MIFIPLSWVFWVFLLTFLFPPSRMDVYAFVLKNQTKHYLLCLLISRCPCFLENLSSFPSCILLPLSQDIWLFLASSYKENNLNLTVIFWHWPILGLALTCLLTIHKYCLEEGQVFIHTFPPLLSAGWPSAQILVVYGQHPLRLPSSHADQLFNFLRITLA